jgi:hypothetical protein
MNSNAKQPHKDENMLCHKSKMIHVESPTTKLDNLKFFDIN